MEREFQKSSTPFLRYLIFPTDRMGTMEPNDQDGSLPEYIYITDELDLHGFFPKQAPEIVNEFIRNAKELNLTTLRIVHGKGKSKMKWTVHQLLKEHPDVDNFSDARPESGGWGATIIELKTK
jgi:DNA-nicking Smr family endonuclease